MTFSHIFGTMKHRNSAKDMFCGNVGKFRWLRILLNRIRIERSLTTSALAVFIPFVTQELFMGGDAMYYGLNALSGNMILLDRKQSRCPNGLVFGTPGSGKTTFLRSIIRYLDTARRIFCVADERGELLTTGHTVHCDVYTRCTKAQAIQMALRCMNPQVIVCDELGTQADLKAVEAGLACGVVFVASVHCDTLEALNRKPPTARLLAMGAFETLVLLDGRVNPGHAVKVRTLA